MATGYCFEVRVHTLREDRKKIVWGLNGKLMLSLWGIICKSSRGFLRKFCHINFSKVPKPDNKSPEAPKRFFFKLRKLRLFKTKQRVHKSFQLERNLRSPRSALHFKVEGWSRHLFQSHTGGEHTAPSSAILVCRVAPLLWFAWMQLALLFFFLILLFHRIIPLKYWRKQMKYWKASNF